MTCNNLQITTCTAAFAMTIQIPLFLKWFRASPLAPCTTLPWLYWSETALFLGRMTGCSPASFKLLNHQHLWYCWYQSGSSWLIVLLIGTNFLAPSWILQIDLSGSFQHHWFDLAVATMKLYRSFLAVVFYHQDQCHDSFHFGSTGYSFLEFS